MSLRYTPQSPTPDSPPATPPYIESKLGGESSSSSSSSALIDTERDYPQPQLTPHYFSMSLPDRLTPEGSPETDSDRSTFVTPAAPIRGGGVPQVSPTTMEDRANPYDYYHPRQYETPEQIAFHAKQLDAARTHGGSVISVDPSRWSAAHLDPKPSPPRIRATSPQSFIVPDPNSFASSSSWSSSNEYRDPALSPTLRSTYTRQSMSDAPYSPAADGKKEPSIKPVGLGLGTPFEKQLYPGDPNLHARSRANGQNQAYPQHAYTAYPVNGQGAVQYKDPGADLADAKEKTKLTDNVGYWLGLYFAFNLGLTLFNKIVLVSFPFPYTLTGLHALSGCAGCYIALERGAFTPAHLTQRENLILAAFSILYTINIAVSNISLQLVTVPFHQVVRASTPIFTIIISAIILRSRFTLMKLVSLLPVVAGVGFATYGDYYFTAWGLILTLLGTFLAALKTVVTNLIQTGGGGRLKLHPLDLLIRMSPLAFIQCVAYGWYTGELDRVRAYGATQMTREKAIALLFNGIIACGLNIVSFTANKKAGALTMTVSANCKQVITIALAVMLFDLHISFTNGIGIFLTLIGGGWYGYVEYMEKRKKALKSVS